MNDNVIKFPGQTLVEIPIEDVLDGAKDKNIDHLVILGRTKDGGYYFASSVADAKDMLWLCKRFEIALMDCEDY